jgi:translation initiation factor 4A
LFFKFNLILIPIFSNSEPIDGLQDQEIETNYDTACESFYGMNLKEQTLHRDIFGFGFERPPRAIVPITTNRDVNAQAQSGTGKTATFAIGILQKIDHTRKECQALILAPTRELAQQIQSVVLALGDKLGISCHACVGGTNVREDMAVLEAGVHVVVGTPGRVYDMINRGAFGTTALKMFVLDEADKLLSRGFKDQINKFFQLLPPSVQVVLI